MLRKRPPTRHADKAPVRHADKATTEDTDKGSDKGSATDKGAPDRPEGIVEEAAPSGSAPDAPVGAAPAAPAASAPSTAAVARTPKGGKPPTAPSAAPSAAAPAPPSKSALKDKGSPKGPSPAGSARGAKISTPKGGALSPKGDKAKSGAQSPKGATAAITQAASPAAKPKIQGVPPTSDVLGVRKDGQASARSKTGMSMATSMQVAPADDVDATWFQPPINVRDKGQESDRSHADLRDRVASGSSPPRTPLGSARR